MELILSDLVVVEKRLDAWIRNARRSRPGSGQGIRSPGSLQGFARSQYPAAKSATGSRRRETHSRLSVSVSKADAAGVEHREGDAGRLHEIEEKYRTGPLAGKANTEVTAVCGKVEAELAELPPADAAEYLKSYGLKESALVRIIEATYRLLGLMSFLTAGDTEVRAWTIR